MADQPEDAAGATPPEAQPGEGGDDQPKINVLAQYIKDLSFENPLGPDALTSLTENPDVKVEISTNSRPLSENKYEATLFIRGEATLGDTTLFIAELTYGGVFEMLNVPEESLSAALLIEGARILFPFARNIIAETTRDGGFPPLMINPIDFVALYRDQHMARGQNAPGAESGGVSA